MSEPCDDVSMVVIAMSCFTSQVAEIAVVS